MQEINFELFFLIFSRFWNFGALFIVKQHFLKQSFLKKGSLEFAHICSTCGQDLSRASRALGIDVQFRWHIKCVSKVLGHSLKARSAHICPRTFETHFIFKKSTVCGGRRYLMSQIGNGRVACSRVLPHTRYTQPFHSLSET